MNINAYGVASGRAGGEDGGVHNWVELLKTAAAGVNGGDISAAGPVPGMKINLDSYGIASGRAGDEQGNIYNWVELLKIIAANITGGGGGGNGGNGGGTVIWFPDAAARDDYFTANPAELKQGISVGVGDPVTAYTYNGENWLPGALVFKGPAGEDGRPGADGVDGREIELIKDEGGIYWRYAGEEGNARLLVSIAELAGPKGDTGADGADGADGDKVLIRVNEGKLEAKYESDEDWTALYDLKTLAMPDDEGITRNADGKLALLMKEVETVYGPANVLNGVNLSEILYSDEEGNTRTARQALDEAKYVNGVLTEGLAAEEAARTEAVNAEVAARASADEAHSEDIAGIKGLIPNQATEDNKLADKNFVNSSINTLAANPVTYDAAGHNFPTHAELIGAATVYNKGVPYTPSKSDYAHVNADEDAPPPFTGGQTRYLFDGAGWVYDFGVNERPFTAAENAALASEWTKGLTDKAKAAMAGLADDGTLSPNDAVTLPANAESAKGTVSAVLNWLAAAVKGITGEDSWFVPPGKSLEWWNTYGFADRAYGHEFFNSTDLNDWNKPGQYKFLDNGTVTYQNRPPYGNWNCVFIINSEGGLGLQIAVNNNDTTTPNGVMFRALTNMLGWTPWKSFIGMEDLGETISNPNLLINGNFDFWQEGTEFNISTYGWVYTADMWSTYYNYRQKTLRSNEVPTNGMSKFSLRVERHPDFYDNQIFISPKSLDVVRTELMTFSGWIKADPNMSTLGIAMSDISVPLVADGNWKYFSLTGHVLPEEGGVNKALLYIQGNANTVGAGFNLAQCKLEYGDVATKFIPEDPAIGLMRCQRYYEKSYDNDIAPGTPGIIPRGKIIYPTTPTWAMGDKFIVQKYTVPTIRLYSIAGSIGRVTDGVISNDLQNTNISQAFANKSEFSYVHDNDETPLVSSNGYIRYHWVADARP